jgi:hypothetical protein
MSTIRLELEESPIVFMVTGLPLRIVVFVLLVVAGSPR